MSAIHARGRAEIARKCPRESGVQTISRGLFRGPIPSGGKGHRSEARKQFTVDKVPGGLADFARLADMAVRGGRVTMRLLVCGGRDFSDTRCAYAVLDRLHRERGIDVVIEGNARGADRIAGYWARKNRVCNLKFPADWKQHGKAAGLLRNQQMIDEGRPDFVLAFPGGRGTADMVSRALLASITVERVNVSHERCRVQFSQTENFQGFRFPELQL